jgi:hypothetical protein
LGEEKEETPAFATAAASCRSTGARAGEERGMASAREARRGELEQRYGWRLTRGGGARQEVARDGRKWRAAVQQQRSREDARGGRRGEEV